MLSGNTSTKSIASLLAILACVFATHAKAELTPQDRLDAIRQSLIEASLEKPTKVQTTTWIDSQGSLRESSSFKNGMEVRGVRVIAYDRDETGQPKARLQYPAVTPEQPLQRPDTNLVKGALQKINKAINKVSNFAKDISPQPTVVATESTACKVKVGEKLKHVMSLNVQTDSSTHPVFLAAFFPLIQSQWIGNASAMNASSAISGWKMVGSLPDASMSKQLTGYERALIGNRPDQLPWLAKLHVRTEQLEATGWAGIRGEKGNSLLVHFSLQVTGAEGQGVVYEDSSSIGLDIETSNWSAPKINLGSMAVLQKELQVMRSNAEEWLACQPLNPLVTAVHSQQVEINAGAFAGVKKGDEWLLANPSRFPAELMSKDGAPQTLLAKVQSVTPFNSQLVILAGPAQSAQANWRAWPTETLMKEPSVAPKSNAVTTSKRANLPAFNAPAAVTLTPF